MAILGDAETVERNLRAVPGSSLNSDATGRLADIRPAVTAFIEERTGRTFGDPAEDEAVLVRAASSGSILGLVGNSALLMLPKAIRTITSVVAGAAWTGSGWTGGQVVPATIYRPVMLTNTGEAMALEIVTGAVWSGDYIVTGTFEDADEDAEVPAEIEYVANLLIGELFKYEQSSAAGVAGPDGQVLQLKNSAKHPIVCAILDKYRASSSIVV